LLVADGSEGRLGVLKTMMNEDRKEVRACRAAIFKAVYLLVSSSFAFTAFALSGGHASDAFPRSLRNPIDLMIVIATWATTYVLRGDLQHARQGLKLRQDAILAVLSDESVQPNPFADATKIIPDIRDLELYWLPLGATIAILVKLLVLP
jgi:hypothetical protein